MRRHGDIGSDGQQTATLLPLTQLLLPSALPRLCGSTGWEGSSNDHRGDQATNTSSAANTFPLNTPWVWGGGVALRSRSGYNLCASRWLVWTQPPQQSLKIQRAQRALQRNSSDGEVVLTLLLVVGHWPSGSSWWSLPRACRQRHFFQELQSY